MWEISKVSGSRETAKAKLAELKKVPQPIKDFVAAQIDAMPAQCASVTVDAFSQDIANATQLTTTRNIQIAIRGIHA